MSDLLATLPEYMEQYMRSFDTWTVINRNLGHPVPSLVDGMEKLLTSVNVETACIRRGIIPPTGLKDVVVTLNGWDLTNVTWFSMADAKGFQVQFKYYSYTILCNIKVHHTKHEIEFLISTVYVCDDS